MSDERLTYTVPEAARLLGVSRSVAYNAVKTGELKSIRLGRRVVVSRHTLEELLGPMNGNGSAVTELVAHTTPANGAPGHGSG